MKKLVIILSVCILLLSGCYNLDLYPLSEASQGNWYFDDTQLTMSVNNVFHHDFWDGYAPWNFYYNTDDFIWRTYAQWGLDGTLTATTGDISTAWNNCYRCIARANAILENYKKASGTVSEEKLALYAANAKFARATQYSKLIFHWGDVPYYEGTLDIDEAFSMGRIAKSEILKKIYADYDYAIANLPIEYSSSDFQWATKGAALAFKARIALYMGDYAIARDAAKDCIDLGVYQLFPDYYTLFMNKTKNSVETIFVVPNSAELNKYWDPKEWLPRNVGGTCSKNPSWDLFCSYLCTDGLPIDESPLFNPREPFKNRDPRCTATIVEFNRNWLGVTFSPHPDSVMVLNHNTGKLIINMDSQINTQWASFDALMWAKRIDEDCLDLRAENDNIIMRFADVLLMYAEAKIELGEIDQTVLDAMNKVRARAYGVDVRETSKYPAITGSSQTALRKTLRIERRMEFAEENVIRYNDIIRWKLAEKVINLPRYGILAPKELKEKVVKPGLWFFPETPPIDEDGVADFRPMFNKGYIKLIMERSFDPSKNYLWPIPSSEIVINKNITQNPGY